MSAEIQTLDVILLLKDFGFVKVTKEHSRGFWCNFKDILNEMTIEDIICQIKQKHGHVVESVMSYKEVSKYFSANL